MSHQVIYIPGLGDKRSYGQSVLLQLWRLFGLTPHYLALGWADKESFEPKLERLLQKIDSLKKNQDKVSLVGVSAGASAALTAFSERTDKLTGVVCISGKIQNPDKINPRYFVQNPAFEESMAGLSLALDKLRPEDLHRVMSIHPIKDLTVPPADTIIPGATERQVPVLGHIQSIFYCLLFSPWSISRFLNNL